MQGAFFNPILAKENKDSRIVWKLASHLAYFESFSLPMQYPELLVASYNNNEDAPHEPDGVALVWNMKYKKTTPEYVFHCQVWFCLGRGFMLMNLDKHLPYLCQYDNFIGLAFILTTFICQQMLVARDFSWEILFCFRISDIIQNSGLFESSFSLFKKQENFLG